MNDEHFDTQMRLARPRFDFPLDFQREIWGRIAAGELASPWNAWGGWLSWLARPIPAAALLLMAGVSGCLLAEYAGRRETIAVEETIYVKAVSPFAAAKLGNGK
jgi:hypothetical protein